MTNIDVWLMIEEFGFGLLAMSTYFAMFVMHTDWMIRIEYWVVRYLLKNGNNEGSDDCNIWTDATNVLSIVLCYCAIRLFIFIMKVYLIYVLTLFSSLKYWYIDNGYS